MKHLNFVNRKELKPGWECDILALMLNARFTGFILALEKRLGMEPMKLCKMAEEILEEGEIHQGGFVQDMNECSLTVTRLRGAKQKNSEYPCQHNMRAMENAVDDLMCAWDKFLKYER